MVRNLGLVSSLNIVVLVVFIDMLTSVPGQSVKLITNVAGVIFLQ